MTRELSEKELNSKAFAAKGELPEDHWSRIAKNLYRESGHIPEPMDIRVQAALSALGIPSGEVSALETDEKGRRTNPEKDRVIAELLTDKAGVIIDKKKGVVSSDFRDIYPRGFPQKLKDALDPDTLAIMEAEYEQAEYAFKRFGDTEKLEEGEWSVNYFRLPGGVDLFLRGYCHTPEWQKNYGRFLREANRRAGIIAIEGFSDKPFGTSLELQWSNVFFQNGHYDILMHEAVDAGFNGLFAEVDARDKSMLEMDNQYTLISPIFPKLPALFLEKYLDYLKRERPSLAAIINSPEKLKEMLSKQSTTYFGSLGRAIENTAHRRGHEYRSFPYLDARGNVSVEPTFRELGQQLFTDAFSAVKLHLIARLMSEGHLPKGPIIDYEGGYHISSKSFFLRYPQYALEVVLRTVNELMAGRVKKAGNFSEIYRVFDNPDWTEMLKEIVKLPFKKVEDDASKPTALGTNQRRLLDYPVDYLKTYNIDPGEVIPDDKTIKEITAKLARSVVA